MQENTKEALTHRQVTRGTPVHRQVLKYDQNMNFFQRWKYHFEQDYRFDKVTTVMVYILIFLLGAVFGFVYEQSFYSLDAAIRGYTPDATMNGWSEWTILGMHIVKRGNQLGPYLPLYGYGSIMMCLILRPLRKKPWKVFLGAAIICGVLEYLTGWAMLEFAGIRGWDYNVEIWNWGNIGGFICIRSVLFFALSGVFLIYGIEIIVRIFAAHLKEKTFLLITAVPFTIFLIDYITNLVLGHGG